MKKKLVMLFVILTVILLSSCMMTGEKPLTSYDNLQVVQSELDSLMNIYSSKTNDKFKYKFSCKIDKKIKDKSFAYSISKDNEVLFSGADEMAVSHAVYTFLEELGFLFDITGISVSENLTTVSSIVKDTIICPKVRWRGIRQHVNFPMDISSYTLPDAKKYIDDLVRLRFNKLTIHSYPGQWYESQMADTTMYAGNFFYGNKHYQYNHKLIKSVIPENDTLFCIPQAEKLRHNPKELSAFAMNWMQELIKHAKKRGFYVQFSCEPRTDSPEKAIAIAQSVYTTYPMIDALELITEETGGWGRGCSGDEVRATLKRFFPEDIATHPEVIKSIRDRQSDLNNLYSQIGANTQAIKQITEKKLFPDVEMKLGIYCSVTKYSEGAYRLARLALPETNICVLSSHGSDGVAKAIPSIIKDVEDLKNTEIYSWIEFDGLMYVLQNSNNGNDNLFKALNKLDNGSGVVSSILYNHWRTAENRTAARYVSESTIENINSTDLFYQDYADKLNITDTANYAKAMKLINDVDSYSTRALGNIGFCWMGAWRSGGSYTSMNVNNIEKARAMYLEAGGILSELIKQEEPGSNAHSYLSLLGNRTVCSILYLDAFKAATAIRTIKKNKDGSVSVREQKRAQEICNHALLIFDKYMETHAEMMPDRGCKGTLVSVWNAPIRGLRVYRSKLGGLPIDELPTSSKPIDAPPLPIFYDNIAN